MESKVYCYNLFRLHFWERTRLLPLLLKRAKKLLGNETFALRAAFYRLFCRSLSLSLSSLSLSLSPLGSRAVPLCKLECGTSIETYK